MAAVLPKEISPGKNLELPRQVSGDALMDACKSIYSAMRLDFGERFMRQFSAKDDAKAWINRLFTRLHGVDSAVVVDGYGRAVDNHRPHLPSLDDIVSSVRELAGERTRHNERLEYANTPKLPAGSGLAGYVEYLAAEADGDVAAGCLALMREILSRPAAATRDEQAQRLAKATAAHDKLLALVPIRPFAYGQRHECGRTGCSRPGTISHSTKGEGPWFCAEHCR